jgi:hypothetical protein
VTNNFILKQLNINFFTQLCFLQSNLNLKEAKVSKHAIGTQDANEIEMLDSYNCPNLLWIEEDTENGMMVYLILSCSSVFHCLLHPSLLLIPSQAQTIFPPRAMELMEGRMEPFRVFLEAQ